MDAVSVVLLLSPMPSRDIEDVVGLSADARRLYDWMIVAFTGDVNEALDLARSHDTSISKWTATRLYEAHKELKHRGVLSSDAPDLKKTAPGHAQKKKTATQLDREIADALAKPARRHATIDASTDDVTAELLRESSYGPGEHGTRVATAKPAKDLQGSPTLAAALEQLRRQHDRTMGFISKPLAYSKAMPHGKRDHANLIRLIKGGFVKVRKVNGPPPEGSTARRDAPYGDRYYELYFADEG